MSVLTKRRSLRASDQSSLFRQGIFSSPVIPPVFFRLHVSASAARELAQAIPIDGCGLCGRKDALAEIGNS